MLFNYKDPKYPETNYTLYFLCVFIVIGSVFLYGKIRCTFKWFSDPLSFSYNHNVDGWILSHLVCFTLAGIYFPNTFILSMIVGILWEIFEDWVGRTQPKWLSGFGDCMNVSQTGVKSKKNKYWWYGQYDDIYADFMGFLIGKYIILPNI